MATEIFEMEVATSPTSHFYQIGLSCHTSLGYTLEDGDAAEICFSNCAPMEADGYVMVRDPNNPTIVFESQVLSK